MAAIAVVIPCFNLGRFVADAVHSVERQTRPATEILISDDGSDDPYTQRVLADLSERCRVIRGPHAGVAAARNKAIGLTHAPYVVLLDADDVLDDRYLEKLGATLDADPDVDFVSSGLRAFGAADYVWTPSSCAWLESFVQGGPHVSSMFRRSLWSRAGAFDESLEGYEDLEFWLRSLEAGARGVIVEEPLLGYRVRAGSRYRQAIVPAVYATAMAVMYRKRQSRIRTHLSEVLDAKTAFLAAQLRHRASLEATHAELRDSVAALNAGIAAHAVALRELGEPVVQMDGWRTPAPTDPASPERSESVDDRYADVFFRGHSADARGTVLTIDRAEQLIHLDGRASPESCDCVILDRVLHRAYDISAVLADAYRVLRPGGTLLCTVHCVSHPERAVREAAGEGYWGLTEASLRRLLAEVFPAHAIDVTPYGNVLSGSAFLQGLDASHLTPEELNFRDPWFPLICGARAVKPAIGARGHVSNGAPGVLLLDSTATVGPGAVVLYHRIGRQDPDIHGLALDVERFREDLAWIRAHCVAMTLDELLSKARQGRLPAGALAVTFDDGYLDNLTVASALLSEFGIPATFFVNSDRLEEEHETWWDEIERLLIGPGDLPESLDLFGDGRGPRPTATPEERSATHQKLIELLYGATVDERRKVVERMRAWGGQEFRPRTSHRVMTADELIELSRRPGHQVGAHTTHHLCLPRQRPEVRFQEMEGCARTLARVLGHAVNTLAYPYGDYDRDTVMAARHAGFHTAVTVEPCGIGAATVPVLVPRFEMTARRAARDVLGFLGTR